MLSRPFVWTYRLANTVLNFEQSDAKRNRDRLIEEVYSECGCLFDRYGGRVVPELSRGSQVNDSAYVVVEVRSLQLRATRDRGFTDWEITAPSSSKSWDGLETVCERYRTEDDRFATPMRILADHMDEIERSLAD
jgi:hypothetical protein